MSMRFAICLLFAAVFCFVVAALQGCSTAQLDATGDVLDILGDAAEIDVALHEPDPRDRDAHRHWCEEHRGHRNCR